MAHRRSVLAFDRELADLPKEMRWREWMSRVEAVIFAAAAPVPREVLALVVGDDCPLEAVIADIRAELRNRPYDLVAVAGGWQHRTRPQLGPVLRAARGLMGAAAGAPALDDWDKLLLAVIAYHQPVTRRDLERLVGRTVDTDAIARIRAAGLVGAGPRSPRQGAPLTYVTTEAFLDVFGLESLADLPSLEDLRTMGLVDTGILDGTPAGAQQAAEPDPEHRPALSPAPASRRTGPPATDLKAPTAALDAASARVNELLERHFTAVDGGDSASTVTGMKAGSRRCGPKN